MSEATDRPQDRGRVHRRGRRESTSSPTIELLERYRAAMRAELGELLDELRLDPDVAAASPQLGLDGKPLAPGRPGLVERARLWDLGIKLGKELANGEDLDPDPGPVFGDGARPRGAPRLTAAQRRALGGE